MNLALGDIISDVSPNVTDSGSSDRTTIVNYINRAQRLLISRLDSKGTTPCRCVDVREQCFALPPEFVEIREADLNSRHLQQRDMFWENRHHQAGNYGRGHSCYGSELVDIGDGFPLPLPTCQVDNAVFGFVAEDEEDAGVSIHVDVIDRYRERVGEDLILRGQMLKVNTASDAYDMSFFHKPVTKGNVKVYQVAPNGSYSLEAIYGPKVTCPSYRRKRLPHKLHSHRCNRLMIRGKLRYLPVVDDTDQLLIGNLDALIFGVKAITAQTIGNGEMYQEYIALAIAELLVEMRDDESEATVAPIHVDTGVTFHRRRCWR